MYPVAELPPERPYPASLRHLSALVLTLAHEEPVFELPYPESHRPHLTPRSEKGLDRYAMLGLEIRYPGVTNAVWWYRLQAAIAEHKWILGKPGTRQIENSPAKPAREPLDLIALERDVVSRQSPRTLPLAHPFEPGDVIESVHVLDGLVGPIRKLQ